MLIVALTLTLPLYLLFYNFITFNIVSALAGIKLIVVGRITILLLIELLTKLVLALIS